MSSCTYLPKLKAEDNIKDHLTNLGAINPVTMEIYAPIDDFEKTLEKMTNDSNNSYFTNLKFFSVNPIQVKKAGIERNTTSRTDTTRTMYQLVTNSESFEKIDEIRNSLGIYESQEAIGSYRQRKKLEIAREQAELQQRLDAARAGVGYTDTYLFSKDLAKIEFQDPTGEIKLTHDLKNAFKDPNVKDRFFSDSNDQTVKSVLDKIIAEGGVYTDLAKHLKDLVVTDIPVQLIELDFLIGVQNGKTFRAGGQYQPDYNNGRKKERIVIPEGAGHLNNDSAHTLMHEIIHALSWRTLENKHKYVVTEEVNAFNEAYNHAKTFFQNNPQYKAKSEQIEYRLSDIHEFLTGMLTDPEFIKDLKNVPISDNVNDIAKDWKTFFDEIIEKLLAMIGITPEKNFYNQASIVASHVLQMQNYVEDINPMTEEEKDMYNRFEEQRNLPLDFFDNYEDAPFAKSLSNVSNTLNLESTIEDVVTKKLQEKIFRIGKVLFEKIELDNVNIHVKKNSETEFSIAVDNKGTSIFGTLSAVLDFQKRDLDSNEIYSPNPKGFILWETFLKSEVASMPKAKVIVDNRFDIALGTLKALKNNGIESIHFPQSFSEDFKKEYSQFLKQDFSSVGFANDAGSVAKTIKISIDDLVSAITAVNSQLKISQYSANSVQLNLQNLELTNEVIDYLYNVSSQRLSRESYGKEVYKLATNLKGSLTNEEVVEKLKCL